MPGEMPPPAQYHTKTCLRMGNQSFWENPTEPSPGNIMHKTGAPLFLIIKGKTITEKWPQPPTSPEFWGDQFFQSVNNQSVCILLLFHRLLSLLPSGTSENWIFSWYPSEGLRNMGGKKRKKEKKKHNYNEEETGKAIIYSNKKTASPLFKTRSYYLSNKHSQADFTTGIVEPFLKKREGENIYSFLYFMTWELIGFAEAEAAHREPEWVSHSLFLLFCCP